MKRVVKMRKKILYITSTLKRCGPNNQLFNIVNNLDLNEFETLVVTLSPEPSESFYTKYVDNGIKVESLNLDRYFGRLVVKNKLRQLIKKNKPDVIHTQGYRADTLISSLDTSIPHIATIRNFPQEDYVMTYGRLLGTLMYRKHTRCLKNVTRVAGVSKSVAENLTDKFNLKNVININNGVDTLVYNNNNSKTDMRKLLDLPLDSKVFISTGHLSERKDPEFMIENFLKCNIENSLLLLVGSGELHSDLEERYHNESSIIFVGRTSRVLEYLNSSDYYISCSKSEGLPNSVLEALACGLPCVLSNIEPHRQIIQSAGSNIGEIYRLGSDVDFIQSINKMISHEIEETSKNATNLAINQYSAIRMSKLYQSEYFKMI
ncbi:glycosyltransferase [Vibrio breoganii]